MKTVIEIKNLNKLYKGGFQALKDINLEIRKGEIFGLLGPNGAGKTTLISTICGITNATSGSITVNGFDNKKDFKQARSFIGLVPQELTTDAFESVWDTVTFSRGLFGCGKDPQYIEMILKKLTLWDKRNDRLMTLSGGMKRRVLIAKALSHGPKILFLDEPTAGVDVELRKDMWEHVHELKKMGVTIILTTHYIDEAEEMADRIGIIDQGKISLVENKVDLMKKMGKKQLIIELIENRENIPKNLQKFDVKIEGTHLTFTYDSLQEEESISTFLGEFIKENICYKDIHTKKSTLEEIFVELVRS